MTSQSLIHPKSAALSLLELPVSKSIASYYYIMGLYT